VILTGTVRSHSFVTSVIVLPVPYVSYRLERLEAQFITVLGDVTAWRSSKSPIQGLYEIVRSLANLFNLPKMWGMRRTTTTGGNGEDS
jgi:hypothetical protein